MRSNRTPLVLAALALLGTLAAACGGEKNPIGPDTGKTWTLTVSVTSEQKQPVRNATVRIVDGPDASKTATTDDSGTAVMYTVKQGSFSIEVTAQEYYRSTASVTLNTSTTVTVALKERNRAPVLTSLVAQGTDPGQPAGMTDIDDTINVTANVTDNETSIANLTFAWTADMGTVTGSGNAVRWRAPSSGSTPFVATISVTITERFTAPGSTTPEENVTKGEVKVRVHDSPREAGGVARNFLLDFSNSSIDAQTLISRYFATGSRCAVPRSSELGDVTENRLTFNIQSYAIGQPQVEIRFQSSAPWSPFPPADAWVRISCSWTSIRKTTGVLEPSAGTCLLTSVYEAQEWRLCASNYQSTAAAASGSQASPFIR